MSTELNIERPTLIVYYCKRIDKVIHNPEVKKGTKYSFIDPESGFDCVYGSVRSIINHFRIKEHTDNGKTLLKIQKTKLEKLKAELHAGKADNKR